MERAGESRWTRSHNQYIGIQSFALNRHEVILANSRLGIFRKVGLFLRQAPAPLLRMVCMIFVVSLGSVRPFTRYSSSMIANTRFNSCSASLNSGIIA